MNKHSFENLIMQCCKASENNLRKWLKKILTRSGFIIIEDDYQSIRGTNYSNVHNMLAIRGSPKVCLVAHTDVCRDHMDDTQEVNPVIKSFDDENIIQDEHCLAQVGGDDRLGVAINTYIALNSGFDMALLFTTDEEIGLISAEQVNFPQLKNYDLIIQTDRGNHSNQLVSSIGGHRLCSPETVKILLDIANTINLPRVEVNGFLTDVLALKINNMCGDAINLCCGYHNSYGARADEYINIREAKETMRYVGEIIKFYDLKDIALPIQNKKRNKLQDNVISLI